MLTGVSKEMPVFFLRKSSRSYREEVRDQFISFHNSSLSCCIFLPECEEKIT